MRWLPIPLLLAVGGSSTLFGQQRGIDPELESYISLIRAVDHHAHPMRVLVPGEKRDPDVDALPGFGIEEGTPPVRGRSDNPEFLALWRDLYGYPHHDATEAHLKELEELRAATIAKLGDAYPSWVLDRIGIETMFANRVAPGKGLDPKRFKWIAFADALMYPLDNSALKKETPDRAIHFADEERLLKRYLDGVKLPPTLGEYTTKIVTPVLERLKREGAIGLKFEMAYLRSLASEDVPQSTAAKVYSLHQGKPQPPPGADYKRLQDYLFRYILKEAGRLNLPVQIHTAAGGLGSYFEIAGAQPGLLEPLFLDPQLRKTKFILIHAGEPWNTTVRALFGKPNVYADISYQSATLYPRALAALLRDWLEQYPERVLFGTDAFPTGDAGGWEETGYLAAVSSRKALALALTGMLEDGEITRERAHELARMVMRTNCLALYDLK